jgi:hypothetical protein
MRWRENADGSLDGNVQRGRGCAGDEMLTRARIERQALIELIAKNVAQNFTRSMMAVVA